MPSFLKYIATVISLGSIITQVIAHGAPDTPQMIAKRSESMKLSARALAKCAEKLQTRDHIERRLERRNEFIAKHLSRKRDFTPNPKLYKREAAVSSAAVSCVLAPEVTVGPYYVPSMLIRDDIREDEPGIETLIEVQIVDVNTCNVVPQVTMDFWHCNSTGSYSGFAVEKTEGLTFNRGLATSDADGIIQITSTFPGWYQGRATHIHVAAHYGGAIEGEHYKGGKVSHIGQIFFDEGTLEEVDQAEVYNTNRVQRLRNADDFIYRQQMTGFDAVAVTQKLGSAIYDGLIVSTTIGIDLSADYTEQLNSGGGPPGGFPSGGFPTGFPSGFPTGGFPIPTSGFTSG